MPDQVRRERRPSRSGKRETSLSQRQTEEARRRARHLEAAAAISSAASSVLSIADLLPMAVELIRERFDLYYAGIFLLEAPQPSEEGPDASGRAVLRAGSGAAGRTMLEQGYSLPVGGRSMIGACLADGRARIALDVGAEAIRFDNPLLPETRSEMALPLSSRGEVVGAMTIQSHLPAAFSPEDVSVLQTMADQLGNAIENARLFGESQRRITELAMVNEVGRALSLALSLDELFEIVHAQVGRLYDASNFYIATYQEGSDIWTSAFHFEAAEPQELARYSVERGMTGHIIRRRAPMLFTSAHEIHAFHESQGMSTLGPVPCSWLGVPLVVADELVGVMAIQDYNLENAYGAEDLALFSTIGAQVAGALRNVRLLEETRRRAHEMELLFQVGGAMTSVLDVDTVLREIVQRVRERFGYFFAGIFLLEGEQLVFRSGSARRGAAMRLEQGDMRLSLDGSGLTAAAANLGEPILVNDVRLDQRYSMGRGLEPVRAELDVPIRAKGRIIGVLSVQSDQINAFDQGDVAILQALANQAGVAIDNARLFAETEEALAETETLYNVSRLLAAAGDLQEVVAAVAEGMFLPGIDRAILWTIERDEQEEVTGLVAAANWHAAGGRAPLPVGTRFSLSEFPAARLTLAPAPLYVEDVNADERLDPATRATLARQQSIALAFLPLWIGRRQSGLLMLIADEPHRFTPREIRPYRSLAGQLAVAVENRRLFQQIQDQLAEQAAAAREKGYLADQLRARAEELTLLNEMGASLAAARDLETVMETIYRDTSRLLDTTNLYIARYDGETGEVRFPMVVEGKQRQPATLHRRASGLAEVVMRSGEPLLIEENLPDRLGALGVTEAEPLPVSWVGVPIKAGDRVLGVLALQNYERAHHFDARDGDLLLAIANQAAIALENIRLFDESQAALAEVEKTHRSYLHAAWQDHLRGRRGLSTGGLVYERPASPERALAGAGPSATVAARKPAAADVANVPDLWRPEMERALKSGFSGPTEGGGGLAVPITLRGQTLGVLGVELPEGGRQWTEDDLALVQAVSEQLAQTLETARLFADTQRSAERERLIGEITSRVRASTDVRAILETAAVELGRALGTSRALVRLATDALPEGPEGTLPGGLVAGQGHEATAAAPTGGSLKGNAVGEDAQEEV